MTITRQTFWYTIVKCDICHEENEDKECWLLDEGFHVCGKCVDKVNSLFAFINSGGQPTPSWWLESKVTA